MVGDRVSLLDLYFDYIGESECPSVFHRWSALTVIGAYLGRRYFLPLGHSVVNPNIYCMLMGSPGTRKSTAIKIASSLAKKAGYDNIAANKTTKEKFLMDLAGEENEYDAPEDILDANLFGQGDGDAEILIAADEFNIFIGNGNIEFLALLGDLWDFSGEFQDKKKTSKSIKIVNPTVSILAGNTPVGFSLAFPPEAIGQGIFSRLILVHGEPTGRKITFPETPSMEKTAALVEGFRMMKAAVIGQAEMSPEARSALDHIYKKFSGIGDVRFESYANRRFTHLLKLCLICSASSFRSSILLDDVILANTILTHTEHTMPKALGEFGKAKHSDVAHKVIQYLESRMEVATLKDIWKQVHTDLEDMKILRDMLSNMVVAEKIISSKGGFLAKRKLVHERDNTFVDFSLLSEEERSYLS